jgi:colanic acid/amylovoran biosynthesis glycosyltransferase
MGQKIIRVVHCYPDWLPVTQTWMYNQVRMCSSKIENHVLCEKVRESNLFHLPRITALSQVNRLRYSFEYVLRKTRVVRQIPMFAATLRKMKPDLVHSHFGNFAWRNMNAVLSAGVPHVVSFYGADASLLPSVSPAWKKMYEQLFKKCALVLCEGPCMAEKICSLKCPEEKISILRIGVDLENIRFIPRVWAPGSVLKILIASSFRPKKGIPLAIEAAARFAKESNIDIAVGIAGDCNPDSAGISEKEKIMSALKMTGLEEKTTLYGYCTFERLMRIALDYHVFLHPSLTAPDGDDEGGAPVVLFEMMASGIPVISTRHCDIPDTITDEVNGFLAGENNAGELASCLKKICSNHGVRESVIRAARAEVEKTHDIRKQTVLLEKTYMQLTK